MINVLIYKKPKDFYKRAFDFTQIWLVIGQNACAKFFRQPHWEDEYSTADTTAIFLELGILIT